MEITGVIESIVFRNEENGYTVAKMSTTDAFITAVGKFLQVSEGENFILTGEFVTNSKFGRQFAFTSYESIMPTSLEGIERYLGSGLIKGVGAITAKAIVNKFKQDTLVVMEYTPEKLATVKRISEKKALEIGESFQAIKKMQNAVMFLQEYNISINLALKIYEFYQEKTINEVKTNPYRLVEDIDGVGFLTADSIAKNMGVASTSEFRIRAGILHILKESTEKNGNTYDYKKALLAKTASLLGISLQENESVFENVINDLVLQKIITTFFVDKKEVVMLIKLYFIEKSIAKKLALLKAMAQEYQIDTETDIKNFEMINGLKFHEDQKKAIDMAVNQGVGVITGGPGTGKTTIIKCIISILSQQNKKVMLMAPTGRAAKRLNESTNYPASTIHRALELDWTGGGYFLHNETNPLEVDAVIVDEISMVDVVLMNSLLKALPRDCRLIMVGDKDQLPSVGAGNVLKDILESGVFHVSYLSKIYRQEDGGLIITNAHLINQGEMPIIDNTSKNFFFESKTENIDVANSIIELVTERLPSFTKEDASKIQVLAPLKMGVAGTINLNEKLQEKINPPSRKKQELTFGQTVFREGDKVMHVQNNYNLTWKKTTGYLVEEGSGVFNGDLGYIYSINPQTGETVVWFDDGRECVYPKPEVNQLSLAYAITIHKSQGSEFDYIVIPVISGPKMILTKNLIYTAVTRAKKLVVLVGEKQALARMIKNNYTEVRLTMLKDFLLEADKEITRMFS
ncbi:MAG: ATP-dependent RecD-like DNA helicase [Christensenellales bacterium]|jgi:exodeoxyribonuclease V alpha subunit